MEVREQLPRSERMRSHSRKRNPNMFYLYHRDHGHDMEECIQLRDEIEELIRRGRLNKFIRHHSEGREDRSRALPQSELLRREEQHEDRPPIGIINTISGGPRRGATSGSIGPPKRQRTEESITFIEEDAQEIQFPHNDAVVVSLNIADYDVRRILVDSESSIDILFYDVFSKMSIPDGRLGPISSPLVEFTGDAVPVEGVITLTVVAGWYPKQSRAQVDFLVVRAPSAYNAILGRPSLNALQAVVSTYHLKLKFPTSQGVGEVRGDQVLARHCYNIALQRNGQSDPCPVDGLDTCDDLAEKWGEPIEDLVSIPLNDGNEEHVVKIGSNLGEEVRIQLINFL